MRLFSFVLSLCVCLLSRDASAQDPQKLIEDAIRYWRGTSSYTRATMTVHRPDWERAMSFEAWTKENDLSMVRFTAPAKDAGTATLTRGREMWSFAPKVQRTVRIPPSMMNQSWMGSDFSHADLSKQTDIIDQYTHRLIREERSDASKIFVVESIPKEESAVVWGKEILFLRDDNVLLRREFFDQDMRLVKFLQASDFARSGDKLYAKRVRITKAEVPNEWTEVYHEEMDFQVELSDSIFSVTNLEG